MEPRSRFQVPLDELDAVHIETSEQVEEQTGERPPIMRSGALPPAYGGGGAGLVESGDAE